MIIAESVGVVCGDGQRESMWGDESQVKVSVLCVICVRVREKNEEGDEMNLVSVRLFSVGERGNLLKIERMVSCGGSVCVIRLFSVGEDPRKRTSQKNVVKGSPFFPNQFPCLFCSRFQVLRDKPKGENAELAVTR
ncbi:orf50 protein product [Corchorus olitorius]|uniref:Orf50 protein product n=1 Tax=Corchorus olitorius TaxID=93759 RepID=A0A1R3KWJ1_9ROSI|nr:orf50 protein product [Corchorus olitorius]